MSPICVCVSVFLVSSTVAFFSPSMLISSRVAARTRSLKASLLQVINHDTRGCVESMWALLPFNVPDWLIGCVLPAVSLVDKS